MSTVVSLLQPDEVRELGLEEEPTLCAAAGIQFVSFPIPDRGVPARAEPFLTLAARLADEIRAGATVAAHCRAGIGRSGLLGASVLSELGVPVGTVFGVLSQARGITVPDTPAQIAWFQSHRVRGDSALR